MITMSSEPAGFITACMAVLYIDQFLVTKLYDRNATNAFGAQFLYNKVINMLSCTCA